MGDKELQDYAMAQHDAVKEQRERAERAERDNTDLCGRLQAAMARVAELAEQLRLTRAWREAWIEHYAKARDGKKRAETDRDAALDLLREIAEGRDPIWARDHADAFLARVDSGETP